MNGLVSRVFDFGNDRGAMMDLAGDPAAPETMPNVAAELRHGSAASQLVDSRYAKMENDKPLPVALPAAKRLAAVFIQEAAEQ